MRVARIGMMIVLISLSACKGNVRGDLTKNLSDTNPEKSDTSPSKIETTKIEETLRVDAIYKIDDSEIALLQNEDILTQADLKEFKELQEIQ